MEESRKIKENYHSIALQILCGEWSRRFNWGAWNTLSQQIIYFTSFKHIDFCKLQTEDREREKGRRREWEMYIIWSSTHCFLLLHIYCCRRRRVLCAYTIHSTPHIKMLNIYRLAFIISAACNSWKFSN